MHPRTLATAAATAVTAALVLVLVGVPSLASGTAKTAGDGDPLRHVTAVTGSRDHGFHVTWSDGDEWWTPTLTETLAECGEYHRAVLGTRCATRARTAYRWMGIVKRSLRHPP